MGSLGNGGGQGEEGGRGGIIKNIERKVILTLRFYHLTEPKVCGEMIKKFHIEKCLISTFFSGANVALTRKTLNIITKMPFWS